LKNYAKTYISRLRTGKSITIEGKATADPQNPANITVEFPNSKSFFMDNYSVYSPGRLRVLDHSLISRLFSINNLF